MAKGSKTRRALRKAAGYGAIFSAAFTLTLYFTFPYELIADRALAEVEKKTGLDLEVAQLRPWWVVGLKADDVKVTRPARRGGEPLEIRLTSVAARLKPIDSLFGGPAVAFDVESEAGGVTGTYQQQDDGKRVHVEADVDGLEVGKLPGVWDKLGVGFQGRASGRVTATLPPGKVDELNGKADLTLAGAKFGGGMVKGFTVPAVDLGDVNLDVLVEKGKLRFEPPLKVESKDLNAEVEGTLDLRPILVTSKANLELRFKPTDAFWDANKKVAGLAQAVLNNAKGGDGWYGYRLGGLLGRPSFVPKR